MTGQLNGDIQNLAQVTAEKERIGAELNVATRIQADMLPRIFLAFPERPEFDIYASMPPAKEVGGNFYDFFLVDDDHLAMVIADVSGKGVPAALFMVIATTLLKNAAQTGLTHQEVLEKVNNQLCENNEAELFVTAWLGIYEISTGKLTVANAGHEYPAIRGQAAASHFGRTATALCWRAWRTPIIGSISWRTAQGTRCSSTRTEWRRPRTRPMPSTARSGYWRL